MIRRSLVFVCLVAAAGLSAAQSDEERGLKLHKAGAFDGLNLFTPLEAGTTYLIDNEGRLIHSWESDYRPGQQAYLLPNGNLLRTASFGLAGNGTFHGGGAGYRIEEFTWEGERIWEFVYASDQYLMHHDVEPLPNGNVLILAWEMKTKEEAIAAGRNPEALRDGELWSEHVIEVKPVRPEGAEIVWEWHLWDHLVQDFDETKDNYGDVAAHPELVDIDPPGFWMDRMSAEEMEELEALGYLSKEDKEKQSQPNRRGGNADWLHINAIAYNAQHDLIALSTLGNNELWVLDHSTTTEGAKGHSGGRYGKGGDLLYRWGNPMAYRLGTKEDQRLFAQHDVHWIPEGRPGAGDILAFNNGRGRPDGTYSSVIQIEPPFAGDGGFFREEGEAWGPEEAVWEYTAPNKKDFNSFFISGAQRQPNGNTLICVGASGTFFEVTAEKEEVWRYLNAANPPPPENADEDSESSTRRDFLRNTVYRVYRYPHDYPAFAGKDLTPGPVLLDYLEDHPAKTPKDLDDEVSNLPRKPNI
ncbi:MAG: aryl-sulfate sulfotransferase [Candidatus Hydrogenedentes bacterium]|nr:aryl-sulfate sulfotransferase [Candidatus Hydrogenedentota bacterium]